MLKCSKDTHIVIRLNDVLLLIFCIMVWFHRNASTDVSLLWKYGFVCAVFVAARTLPNKFYGFVFWCIVLWGVVESIIGLAQCVGFMKSNHHSFMLTGTFQNPGPLGGLLGVTLPLTFSFVCRAKRWKRFLCFLFFVLIAFVLFLSCSRAGWVAGLVGIAFCIGWNYSGIRRYKVGACWLCLLLFCSFLAAVYFLNPDSANGRLLIWYNSLQMWLDNPIWGVGTDGWLSRYMLYQANFFMQHPQSPFLPLADNVAYPYNEFIHLLAFYGIVGIILFGWIVIEAFPKKHDTRNEICLKVASVSFLVFSFFSYPFGVVRLQMLFAILLGMSDSRCVATLHVPSAFRYARITVLLCFFTCSFLSLYIYRKAWDDWTLYPYFRNNPFIMDSYAQKKSIEGNEKDIPFYEKVASLYPTSDLYVCLGNACRKGGDYNRAEFYLKTASYMVPKKVVPLYELFQLYCSKKDYLSARNTALDFLSRPVKMQGTRYLRMKGEMKRFLHCHPTEVWDMYP